MAYDSADKALWCSAYNAATEYDPGNEVASGGKVYTCIAQTTGNAPPNATYWEVSGLMSVDSDDMVAGSVDDSHLSGGIANGKLATDPLARANHTGSQTASTVSDFDTQVRTNRLDQMATPTSDVALGSKKLTGVLDPTADQDAATKKYVDDARYYKRAYSATQDSNDSDSVWVEALTMSTDSSMPAGDYLVTVAGQGQTSSSYRKIHIRLQDDEVTEFDYYMGHTENEESETFSITRQITLAAGVNVLDVDFKKFTGTGGGTCYLSDIEIILRSV